MTKITENYEFPKLYEFLESNIAEDKGIGIFKEFCEDRKMILIGYFRRHMSMAEVSKKLPRKALSMLKEKLKMTDIQIIDNYVKKCRFTGKPMVFVALIGSNNILEIDKHF